MKARNAWIAAGILLVACGTGSAASEGAQNLPQSQAQTSHRMRSVDKELAGTKYLKDARIQPEQAMALALGVFDGEVIYARLEKKPGGSGLRYSFVIRNRLKGNHQVDIDANDGTTLADVETPRFR